MFAVRFVLVGIRKDGSELELFRWTRDAESGIARATREAREFGMEFDSIEARPAC